MFTGIISHLAKLEAVKQSRYTFSSERLFFKKVKKGRPNGRASPLAGDSVAVNGICLTVIAQPKKNTFSVEVMPETLRKTNFGELKIGDYVNLELPVSADGFFSGHIVQGHIDGIGIITSIVPELNPVRKDGDLDLVRDFSLNPKGTGLSKGVNSWIFRFKVKKALSKYLIEKGSVAVNGISLTVIEAGKDFFTVGIIPHTWKNTVLKYSKIGDKVNIEVDVIAKYVASQLNNKQLNN